MLPGVIYQNSPHELRRDTIKLGPVLPARILLIDETQIGFIDERGGLQCVSDALFPQVVPGQPAQLAVNERHQLIKRLLVASTPSDQ